MTSQEVVTIIAQVVASGGVLIFALGYGYAKFAEGRDRVLREDNEDLRKSRSDQDRKIVQLQKDVAHLQGQVKILTQENMGNRNLIINALENYLSTNPEVLKELYKEIKGEK